VEGNQADGKDLGELRLVIAEFVDADTRYQDMPERLVDPFFYTICHRRSPHY
jgi:hypothetical protein